MYAQDTPKPEFKPSGKLWGYVFADYYYKVHADSLNRGTGEYSGVKENANAFDFRRVYLGYDYNISEKFSAELLLSHEAGSSAGPAATNPARAELETPLAIAEAECSQAIRHATAQYRQLRGSVKGLLENVKRLQMLPLSMVLDPLPRNAR